MQQKSAAGFVPIPETSHSSDPLEWIKRKAAAVQASADKKAAETPVQMFLPGMTAIVRAMPNPVARSSLFAPIARGRRKFHNEMPLVTRADAVMSYTGEQLDEADADLALQLIYEARPFPLGQPVTINRAALLRAMGRATGKTQYDWLHRRMKALTVATLFIETRKADGSAKYRLGHAEAFHIVQSFRYSEDTETYTFTLDPRWAVLFGNREYALLDWKKRLQIGRGQDMAKTLQRLLATSANPVQRYGLDWLKSKMQYASPLRKFRSALAASMRELERLEIVSAWKLEHNTKSQEQLTVWLAPSA